MRVLNFGSLNRDLVYSVAHAVRPGETLASSKLETFCGGKGLNQSLALARAGAQVWHAGCVGADGGELRKMLADSGVDTRYVREVDGSSGHAVIQVDSAGQNSILLYGGANQQIAPAFADEVLADFGAGDLLVLQNEISAIPHIMRQAKARGMRIAWNPSPFAPELTGYPLDTVTCFVLNEIEGAELTGETAPGAILAHMRAAHPSSCTLLTLGSRGAMYDDGTQVYRADCFRVPVQDTTAAGDTFLGYFFASLDRCGPAAALRLASAASALAVSVKGAANSIPTLDQAEAFLAEQE